MRNLFFPLLFLLYLLFLLFGLGSFPLIDWDENIYGAASKGMWESGEFFRIQVNGQIFSEKPPFYFWLANAFYGVFGLNEFSTRMPSVLSGLISFFILVRLGSSLHSRFFGYAWAFLYSASFLPLLLSRTAYIDHLFNTLILLSVISLYFYEENEGEEFKIRVRWIFSSAFFGGMAVLTKGPLGLGIPLIIFAANRILERRWKFKFFDFVLFGFVSLLVLSFYYLTNYILYGEEFLVQFFDFQKKLLTKSLESHTGPWFYHFIVMFIGFFPWTILLFAVAKNWKLFTDPKIARFSRYFLIWLGLVLAIFSVVQTKLPHYSSSIYFALSFFASYLIAEREEALKSKWIPISFLGLGLVIGLLFAFLPNILEQSSSFTGVGKEALPKFTGIDSLPGIFLCIGILLGSWGLWSSSRGRGEGWYFFLLSTWTGMMLFVGTLSATLAPKIISFLQDGNLRLYDQAEKSGNPVIFYKYLSFYPMFYREQKIHIVGSYKFKDEVDLFESDQSLAIICNRNSILELMLTYPKREFKEVSAENGLVLLTSSLK
ncbi:glycosyltransferase family 39 protein [Leptospira semungkisensis]|uniref:Glycosyltransferase family 39 protein n=1 Tax=Leptospira semungkisensis TaxID=2484985 RepID=A0A4R9FLS3_9LEPT|nr:glycosyltransferase family 39 protein [Leptospira semungkisensis]TGJ99144.1 glycosyltransferase family 39 protein [Leptospira semungkisensis]